MGPGEASPRPPRTRPPVPSRVIWFIVLIIPTAVTYGFILVWIGAYLPEIGFGSEAVGLLLGSNGAALVLGSVPLSLIADRKGKKLVLLAGLLAIPPTSVVFALTQDFGILVIASVLTGLEEGAFLSTWNALIADQTVRENRDPAFALSFMVGAASMGLGYALPYVFPFLEEGLGASSGAVHAAAMLVVAALAIVSPVGLFWLLRGYREPPRPPRKMGRGQDLRPLWKFSGINSLIGLGAGFIVPLVPLWLWLKFGVPDTYSGPLLGVANLTIGFAAIGSAWLSRRFGSVRAIVLTQGLATAFMFALAFTPDAMSASGVYIVRAALMNMSSPIADAFLMGIVAKEQRSFASAVNGIVWRLPNSVSTVGGGALMGQGLLDLPIYIAAGFYAIGVTLLFLVFRHVKPTT